MRDAAVFALAILAVLCAECIPAMLALTALAAIVALGGKIPSVCEYKKAAPGGSNTRSSPSEK